MSKSGKNLDDFFKNNNKIKETEELHKYIDEISSGVDPNKLTFTDKIASFFKNVVEKIGIYYPDKDKEDTVEKHSTFQRKLRVYYRSISRKITEKFNFEQGVDILDDVSVLYRRNRVNKNILLVTNIVFIIFTIIGNQNPNFIVIAGFGVIMLSINTTLKPRDTASQAVAVP